MDQKLSECQICYKICTLVSVDKRACPHYFHVNCMDIYQHTNQRCPIKSCEKNFDAAKEMPDFFESPKKWLSFADSDNDKELNKKEVLAIVLAVTVFESGLVMEMINDLFSTFDKNGNGQICMNEFASADGFFELLRANSAQLKYDKNSPELKSNNKDEWFDFWDLDKSGEMDQAEIVRALIKTFKLNHDIQNTLMMKDVIKNVFAIFDTDASGVISKKEFCSNDGLADSIIAQMAF